MFHHFFQERYTRLQFFREETVIFGFRMEAQSGIFQTKLFHPTGKCDLLFHNGTHFRSKTIFLPTELIETENVMSGCKQDIQSLHQIENSKLFRSIGIFLTEHIGFFRCLMPHFRNFSAEYLRMFQRKIKQTFPDGITADGKIQTPGGSQRQITPVRIQRPDDTVMKRSVVLHTNR